MADCTIKLVDGSEYDFIGSEYRSIDSFDFLEDLPITSSLDIQAFWCAQDSIDCFNNEYELKIIPLLFLFYHREISYPDLLEKIKAIYRENGNQSSILSEIIDDLESSFSDHNSEEDDSDEEEIVEGVMDIISEIIGEDVFSDDIDEIEVDPDPIPASKILYLIIYSEDTDYSFRKDFYFEPEVYEEFQSDSKTSPESPHFKYLMTKWSVFLAKLLQPASLEPSLYQDTVKDALISGNIRDLLPYGIVEYNEKIIYINHNIPKKPKTYQFPQGTKVIKPEFIGQFDELLEVIIPDSAEMIQNQIFENSQLESVIIPDGVTDIGNKAFYNSRNLKTVHLPENLKKIGESAFDQCHPELILAIPENVCEIGYTERKDLLQFAFDNGIRITLQPEGVPKRSSNSFLSIFYTCYEIYKNLKKVIESSDTEKVSYLLSVLDIPAEFSEYWHIGIMRAAINSSPAEITAILLNSGKIHFSDAEIDYLIGYSSEIGKVEQTALLLNIKK